jgi:hypothetical protein
LNTMNPIEKMMKVAGRSRQKRSINYSKIPLGLCMKSVTKLLILAGSEFCCSKPDMISDDEVPRNG